MNFGKNGKAIKVEKSNAQLYLEENFAHLIQRVNTQFRHEMGDSSAQSTTDETHILHYDSFRTYYMEIAKNVFVLTTDWALCFIQETLQSTTYQLCRVIHTEDLEFGRGLIQRVAVWMMEKCTRPIDPWSWSNCEQFQATVTTPTPRQVAIINKEIDEFYLKIYRPCPGEDYNATFQALYEDITNSVTSCDQLEPTLDQLPLPAEISIHNKVFNGFIAFLRGRQDQINPAHIACALTRATIPFNTDIFFDAIQFSNNRVTDAASAAGQGFKEVTKKLYKQYLRRDFIHVSKLFESVNDICPIKLLAIYRAVKFLVSVRHGEISAKTGDFNSEIEDHNVFPLPTEKAMIDQGLMEIASKLFQDARKKFGDEFVDNFQPPATPIQAQPTIHAQVQNSLPPDLVDLGSPEEYVNNWLNDGTTTTMATNNFNFPSTSTQAQVEIVSFIPNNFNLPCMSNMPPTPFMNPLFGSSSPSSQIPCTSTCTNNTDGGFSDNSTANVMCINENLLALNPPTATPPVIINHPCSGKFVIPAEILAQAKREFDSLGTIKSGKVLYHALFTDEEKRTCTVGGKKGFQIYPQDKVNAIYEALEKFERDSGAERTVKPFIKTKVFDETGSQFRNPKKPNKKQASSNSTSD